MKLQSFALWPVAGALLVATVGLSMMTGVVGGSMGDFANVLGELIGVASPGSSDAQLYAVVTNIRAPRVLTAVLVGAALGSAGASMQGMFRNPLADPSLMGVSLGAALGAACVLVLISRGDLTWLTPGAAFVGGLGATLMSTVAGLRRRGAGEPAGVDTASLLLAGVAVQAFCGAAIGLLTYIATDSRQRDLTFWLLGSLGGSTWTRLGLSLVPLSIAILAMPRLGRALDVLALGEAEARDLGVPVERVRIATIALTSLGVGAAVAVTGPVSFIGLIVPHICRVLGARSYGVLIVASAIVGAELLVISDLLARTIAKPAELPIGVVTAFLGAPFFYVLLMRRRREE